MKPCQKKALNDTMYGGDTNPNSGPIGFLYGETDGGGGGDPSMCWGFYGRSGSGGTSIGAFPQDPAGSW